MATSLKEIGVIYKITNKINGKIYIGKTFQDVNVRFIQHFKINEPTLIHKAMIKYGIDNFSLDIIYSSPDINDINNKEIYYINYYGSRDKSIGYNICKGGEGTSGRVVSDAVKLHMSYIMGDMVQNLNTGEVYRNMYEAERQVAGKITAGLNAAIRRNRKFKGSWWIKLGDNPPLNEDEREIKIKELEKISKLQIQNGAKLRSKINKEKPPVAVSVICIETQEIFNTISEANLKYKCDIHDSLRYDNRTAAGYHWCRLEDKERIERLNLLYKGKGSKKGYKFKPLMCIDTNQIFNSKEEFKSFYPLSWLSAAQCCARRETKTSHGLRWKYLDNENYKEKE